MTDQFPNTSRRLEGSIVVLEPLSPRHEEALFEVARDERIWRWMPPNSGESRETFHAWMELALEEKKAGVRVPFATLDSESGKPIGSTSYLALRPEHLSAEIGWTWISPPYWKTGANVEAKLLMLGHAFETLGCRRVELKTDFRNERSRKAMESIPAKFEGVLRNHMVVHGGGRRDSAYYSVTDGEWPDVKANLLRRLGR
ncbi:MAG: GNAT family N-acetyltransferase [Rubrobacteraceae bacterium]